MVQVNPHAMPPPTVAVLLLANVASAVRLVTTTSLPGVDPASALRYLATPGHWPDIVLSSWAVVGSDVDAPMQVGESVDEVFGLPPLLPLEVRWTCTASDDTSLVFDSPSGLDGVAKNCRMEFSAAPEGDGSSVELAMSYEPLNLLAELATPVLALDNAIALKLTLPSKIGGKSASPLGTADPIAGPLVAFSRSVGLLPAEEADGWTGEPTAWAESDSIAQRLSEWTQSSLGGFKQFAAEAVAGEYDAEAVDGTLDEQINAGGVVVYAFASCPFCKKAKELLDAKSASYTWLLLDDREDGAAIRARLGARTGRTSVPSVWMDGAYCGGLNDGLGEASPGLVPLEERGELDARLRAAGAIA